MNIIKLDAAGDICRVVTSCKGSRNGRDAFQLAVYRPAVTLYGRSIFRCAGRGSKFANTRSTRPLWKKYGQGALHNIEIAHSGTDDYGNMFYVV